MLLYQILAFNTCVYKNTKMPYKNNRFKISAPTWYEELEFTDGSCSITDI